MRYHEHMRGFVDLHSHWVAGVDDGANSATESLDLLRALHAVGFDTVMATPHMRPGMFDNLREDLIAAYDRTHSAVSGDSAVPQNLDLASEHYFDDIVFARLLNNEALPYPGQHAVLIELNPSQFPAMLPYRLQDLLKHGLRPVIAHPERYAPVWSNITVLDSMLDVGALLLLDVAALVGKYGRAPMNAAKKLADEGYYYAACSDAHKASDVDDVAQGIETLFRTVGTEEATFLLHEGPSRILSGQTQPSANKP